METPSENGEAPALLVCQDCGAVTPWEDWLDPEAFECCPKCGSHNAKLKRDDPPPSLPELTDDEKTRSLYHVPFNEAFGKPRIEILLKCRACGHLDTFQMWEYAGRFCPECGGNKGADRA